MISSLDQNSINSISPLSLKEYISTLGWNNFEVKSQFLKESYFFLKKNSTEVLIPKDSSYADFYRRIDSALDSISFVEQKTKSEIVKDLNYLSGDIIKIRLSGPSTENGSIPFEDGVGLFQNTKKLLFSTALQLVEPKAYHKRLRNVNADAFIRSCRIGQTEKGSFVATVICPVDIKVETEGSEIPNFTRAVTSKLIEDVSILSQAIDENSIDVLAQQNIKSNRLSWNFCESLGQLQGVLGNVDLDVAVTWSPKINEKVPEISKVRFRRDQISYLEKFTDKLKPEFGDNSDTFMGKIDSLNGQPNESGQRVGEVIYTFQYEEELIKAKVFIMEPEQYGKAAKSHLNNSFVKIIGTLKRSARISNIVDVKEMIFDI